MRRFAALPFALACLLLAGLPRSSAGQDARRLTLGASGDILFHTRVVAAARARSADRLFAELRSVIAGELAFANLETPLSEDRVPRRGNPPTLGAPGSMASVLARVGLDVLSVANNHAWDQRAAGMADTLAALEEAEVAAVGAAVEESHAAGPVVVHHGGLRVAFVAFTTTLQGSPGTRTPPVHISMWERRAARRVLRAARSQADVVVASMHWGIAYRHRPRREQRERARWLVREGADVVLGHGPHVLQPVERLDSPRGQALVAYSLGNLISNQGYLFHPRRRVSAELPLREPATRDGVWLRLSLSIDREDRVAVEAVDAVPLFTANNWYDEQRSHVPPDIQAAPLARHPDEALRTARARRISRALGDAVRLIGP